MKTTIPTGYRADLADIAEGLNDLMADLEDVRDEAQDLPGAADSPAIQADVQRIDAALRLLMQAAETLEEEQ